MNPYDRLLIYALPYQMVTKAIMAGYCFPSSEAFSTIQLGESFTVSTVTIFSAVR